MKTKVNPWLHVLTLLGLTTLNSQFSTAFAQSTAFTYQGRLNDSGASANGSPIEGGSQDSKPRSPWTLFIALLISLAVGLSDIKASLIAFRTRSRKDSTMGVTETSSQTLPESASSLMCKICLFNRWYSSAGRRFGMPDPGTPTDWLGEGTAHNAKANKRRALFIMVLHLYYGIWITAGTLPV